MARYGKSNRPQGNASNRAKRVNKRESQSSRYTSGEHDKRRRPPGKGQSDPRGHRGRPS